MCDTVVAAFEGQPTWLAKNSDREPGEAQAVERVAGEGGRVLVISRPAWMWGAEMGVNNRGLAIANEAVFTREPVAAQGRTGMDLLRDALAQCDHADDALECIVDALGRTEQGGRMGYRQKDFRYHSSFVIADAAGSAWLLETAGPYWAALRIRGLRAVSNALTIGAEFDRVHPHALARARSRGFAPRSGSLHFAGAFGSAPMGFAAGAAQRRACVRATVAPHTRALRPEHFIAALTGHGGHSPSAGWRMRMPCAHASYHLARQAGQTTGSMVARLGDSVRAWFTGRSSPCLSVFKPVSFAHDVSGAAGRAGERRDSGLWWTHEAFHRAVMQDYAARHSVGGQERAALQAACLADVDDDGKAGLWREHAELLPGWRAAAARTRAGVGPFSLYWRWQARRDAL